MTGIWSMVDGVDQIQPIAGSGMRLVESQEEVATTKIVSNLSRQSILEEMLDDSSKPSYREGTQCLHYLLSTPFRYPPLRHGSRFGGQFEPSLFYGGLSISSTLSESAFYRFYFYHDQEEAPRNGFLQSQHTLFGFRYKADRGIKLQCGPFVEHEALLRDPTDYGVTQELGNAMRNEGVLGFEYKSARDKTKELNVALYEPSALLSKKPFDERACICRVDAESVTFRINRELHSFGIDEFIVNGVLPIPSE